MKDSIVRNNKKYVVNRRKNGTFAKGKWTKKRTKKRNNKKIDIEIKGRNKEPGENE